MFDWGPSLARVDITPSGRPTLNGQQFATNVVNNMPYMNEDVQHVCCLLPTAYNMLTTQSSQQSRVHHYIPMYITTIPHTVV